MQLRVADQAFSAGVQPAEGLGGCDPGAFHPSGQRTPAGDPGLPQARMARAFSPLRVWRGGSMPYSAVTQPRPELRSQPGDSLLDGGVAEDAGVAGFDEDGAFGHGDVVGGEADGTEKILACAPGLAAIAVPGGGVSGCAACH
jgi:hypothetical protein